MFLCLCMSNLQKQIFQTTILNLKFEFPAHNSKQLFKFHAQDKVRLFLDRRFEKRIALSEKATFSLVDVS